MKPTHIGNAHFSHSGSSDAEVADTSRRQQQSSGTTSQEHVNPALEGLGSAPRSRRVSFGSWVGVQGESRPVGLDSREKHEKYPDGKYKASSENRQVMIEEYGRKTAERLYETFQGAPLPKEYKANLKEGSPSYMRIRGNEKERKKEGAVALKHYEYLARDANDPKLNYEHKTLYAPKEVRRSRLRELEADADQEQGGASSSGS
ncbi:type III secretion system effector XopW [Xanthomonas oryzae]|uniref:Type III effector protein XopW n=1 Tax=Xanthomonas oryzae pv. oryzicola (strain BLS256) TaxID=383407 RepID=G7T9P9_XANOB|nr:type III secretion system effector XopW [Xanthomonas oryzae]AEQ94708.1 type III effector protein XopW [Xanthomonas oryzae pv. oryzicola BLS256]WVN06247.1 type III secretion system effector XopW [Xanthomonas oryzae pv. oryzicola]WVN06258.1 type III secretion system effector XopW [Xanthomonas oryzae pv. oryzicola]